MTEISSLIELGKMGVMGLFLALVGLIFHIMRLYAKLSSNHIEHSYSVIQENTKVNTELVEAVKGMREMMNLILIRK